MSGEELPSEIVFKKASTEKQLQEVYNYELEAFAEYPGFEWTFEKIKEDVKKKGWTLYSVMVDNEIVAAAFLKKQRGELLTKNTPIKMAYQGNGISHQIKDFFEEEAHILGVKKIINYCPNNNFRLIALNESHGYQRVKENKDKEHEDMQKWSKTLK